MLKIHSKPDRNQSKLTVCKCQKVKSSAVRFFLFVKCTFTCTFTYTLYISQVWNDLEWTGLQNGLVFFFTAFFFKGFYGWLEITVENNTNTFHLILKCLLWIRWYHFNHKVWSILWKESSLGPSISYVVSKLEILTPSHPPLAVFFIKQGCCNSRYPQGQHPC